MSHNRNRDEYSLTYDQRVLLDLYINFYNHTTRQIDTLYELQNNIREKIEQIAGLSNESQINTNYHLQSQNTRQNYQEQSHTQNHQTHRSNQSRQQRTSHPQQVRPTQHQSHTQTQTHQTRTNQGQQNNNQRNRTNITVPYIFEFDYYQTNNLSRQPRGNVNSFYENIPVIATLAQQMAATRIVTFSQIAQPLNNSCPVTLDRFQPDSRVTQLVSCGHIFTTSGITAWLQTNVRCPVCRHDIRYITSNVTPQEETKDNDDNEDEETKTDSEPTESERQIPPISNLTESLLESLFSPSITSQLFDISQNSLFYDSSNNQLVFEGFLRRPRL